MQWSTLLAVTVVLGAGLASADPTASNSTADSLSLGFLNFLKPILLNVVGLPNLSNLVAAINSRNISQIANSVLSTVDPGNSVHSILNVLNNYETHMWDQNFRQQIGAVVKGISKSMSSGMQCFFDNVQTSMKTFTSSYVDAMNEAFNSSAPNSTAPASTGLSGLPTALLGNVRLLFRMLTGSKTRDSIVSGLRSFISSFPLAYGCARNDTTDLTKALQSISTILQANASTSAASQSQMGAQSVAPVPVLLTTQVPAVTTTTARSKFLGLF